MWRMPIKTTFDLIYINNYPNTDRFPKPLNGEIEDQTEQFEVGGILYARNKSLIKDTDLDGYFIYKGNDPNYTTNNIRVNNGYPFRLAGGRRAGLCPGCPHRLQTHPELEPAGRGGG